jgi:endo-1,4-beta-xylanase
MARISRRQFTAATVSTLLALKARAATKAMGDTGLKEVFRDDFLVGTAINTRTLADNDTRLLDLVAREFNAITAANCMKWMHIEPAAGQFDWKLPDRFVEFGVRNRMTVVGHTLVWHQAVPKDLFVDAEGKPVGREKLLKRLETHVSTVVDRYRRKIAVWDVVNEAVEEDEQGWRKSPWYEILGPVYMRRAFSLAHEADKKATLLYNDYNEHNPGRRRFLVDVVRDYKRRDIPIHGIGLQGHVGLDYPDLTEYENSIVAFAREGMRLHVTELDVDVLPRAAKPTTAEISATDAYSAELDPWKAGLPADVEEKLTARYRQLFALFVKHREHIDRVSTWGTHDGESWKNNFPIRGRTNYPLLFDRSLAPKPAYEALKRG